MILGVFAWSKAGLNYAVEMQKAFEKGGLDGGRSQSRLLLPKTQTVQSSYLTCPNPKPVIFVLSCATEHPETAAINFKVASG